MRHGVGAGLRFDASGGQPGYALGTSEPAEQEALARLLRPGAVLYDIGANIGFFAVIGARLVGDAGRVYAFEPFPPAAAQLRRNAALNAQDQVTVVEAAVGAAPSSMHLATGDGWVTNRLTDDQATDGIQVDVVAIDGWRAAAGAPAPDVVLLDVEGAEIDALRGMLGTLASDRPTVLCEVHWIVEEFFNFVEEHLAPLGYRLEALEGDVPTTPERWHAVLSAR